MKFRYYSLVFAVLYCSAGLFGADTAKVRKLFPKSVLSYLSKKEVPRNLQEKLDLLFGRQVVEESLAVLYDGYKRSNSLSEQEKKARKELENAGFSFASDDSSAVFSHKDLPKHILKIGTLNKGGSSPKEAELYNAGRIKFSDILRQKIAQKKYNVVVPHKMAYFTQFSNGPQMIVVAEKIELSNAVPCKDAKLKFVRQQLSYYDDHANNVLYDKQTKQILLFDTEPLFEDVWDDSICSMQTLKAVAMPILAIALVLYGCTLDNYIPYG